MGDSADDATNTIEDPPDWFGADGDPDDGHPGGAETPEGADWFDDPTYLDPTPDDATGAEHAGRPTDADMGNRTASSPPEAGSGATGPDAGSGATADPATTAGGTDRITGAERDTGRTGEVFRDEQGRQVRKPAEPDEEVDDSGGILAWLKRLLGLN